MNSLQSNPNKESFSIFDTNVAKGLAVVLLLIHHLFYLKPGVGPLVYGFSPIHFIALVSKVCVAIFVLLSGYGLSLSFRHESIAVFWKKRLVKLFLNYWLMWIIFVPVGVLIFNRTLDEVFEDHALLKTILNIFGLQMYFGYYGYNPTWWFISLTLALYLCFPFLKMIIDSYGFLGVLFSLPFLFIGIKSGTVINFDFVLVWIVPYSIGIYLANKNTFVVFRNWLNDGLVQQIVKLFVYICAISLVIWHRQNSSVTSNVRIDGLFAFLLILFSFEYLSKIKYLNQFLRVLGEHSFNIFLFHTFIYLYFFPSFFNAINNPLVAVSVLTLGCLTLSIFIEWIKKRIYFYQMEEKILS